MNNYELSKLWYERYLKGGYVQYSQDECYKKHIEYLVKYTLNKYND